VFLDTSRITYEAELKNQEMLQRRVLRRTRATAVIFGILFVVAILFFLLSYIQKIKADEQTRIAESERQEAQVQRELAIREKAEADKQKAIAEETAGKLEVSLKSIDDAFKVIKLERDRAELALQKAVEEEKKAIQAREEERSANALFMLAVAQTLAAKSVQEDDDRDLKGLLAMQGYRFHTRYEGKKYDPYIYSGLYSSLSKLNGASYNAIRAQGAPHVHIKSLVVSNNDNAFYTVGADGRILKGDYSELTSTPTGFKTNYPGRTIALSKDENYLVSGSDSSTLFVYNIRQKEERPVAIKGFKGSANDIEFLPDGSGFILAASDRVIYKGNHIDGKLAPVATLPNELKAISIHPDGNLIAGATWTGEVLLFDLASSTLTTISDDRNNRVLSVKFSPDGKTLAYGIDDVTNKRGLVKLYSFADKTIRQLSGHRAAVTDVEFSPDGKLLASAGSDKRLLLWLLENPEELPITMDNNNGFIWDISFTKSSQYLIAACSESEIRVWPTDPALLAEQICPKLKRNMTQDEWKKYVGKGEMLQYEPTCPGL
jgi:hypothetical protein